MTLPAAQVVRQIDASEADQGVAAAADRVFAIDNNRIAGYALADGRRLQAWQGDAAQYPHINSCTVVDRELACAASNYPGVPQTSAIEFFDARSLRHLRTVSLGIGPGSLTVVMRHAGAWWAVFANYDGKGGEPGRDHRYTLLTRLDAEFRVVRGWTFPAGVLDAFAPSSCSGADWGRDGLLYASGHDRREVYVLSLPDGGSELVHVATIPVSTPGQAIAFDAREPRVLWTIDRAARQLVASRLPELPAETMVQPNLHTGATTRR